MDIFYNLIWFGIYNIIKLNYFRLVINNKWCYNYYNYFKFETDNKPKIEMGDVLIYLWMLNKIKDDGANMFVDNLIKLN